ncbi:MAG TPA: electron transport complex subunit RsxC [Gammaproteobacteria bacterium]|nr:electron transport complex subunit RsxC [Gammaproteobacteria bacterium]
MTAGLFRFPGGVHPPQHKQASTTRAVRPARLPNKLILPLHQHIGESAEAVVEVGDTVLKGQPIAKATGFVSAAVHAPSSGVVTDIGDYPVPHPSGLSAPCVVIETDGEDRWIKRNPPADYRRIDPSHLRNLIREAGIVGLGGAGFPSFIKLNPGRSKHIDTLILNGIECEPYITCDDMLMRERAGNIIEGLKVIRHALQARRCVIAVEDNKPEAYAAMQAAAKDLDGVDVVLCPTIYPQGSEKQLIQVITGKEVPGNRLPLHIGVVVHNVGTAHAVYQAVIKGRPLISRYVTVTGAAVGQACNLDVLIGTPMIDLLNQCDVNLATMDRLIMGGPMMGYALHTVNAPVIKTTNCLLAATAAELPPPAAPLPCIRCGACMGVCPVSLLPQQLYWHAHAREFDKAQNYNLFDCIECGCCAYVCPSRLPLVQYYRYAKGEIWKQEREKEKADLARQRHDARLKRLEREKAERAARHKKKKKALQNEPAANGKNAAGKKAAIQEALERVRAKKERVRKDET